MERLNIGSKPYNKSSKNTQNRLTYTTSRSQSFANSEQRTANSVRRTPRTYFIPKHNHRLSVNKPTQIIARVPKNIPEGKVQIVIRTRFTGGSNDLKELREIVYRYDCIAKS